MAIFTRYLEPTRTKGARIKAFTTYGTSIIIDFHHNHRNITTHDHDTACKTLARELELEDNEWFECGSTADAKGHVYVKKDDLRKI